MNDVTDKSSEHPVSLTADREKLITRINEIYHDFQAGSFNKLHRRRHKIERIFWARDVAALLSKGNMTFGIDLCSGTGFVPRVLRETMSASARMVCIDLSGEALGQYLKSLPSDERRFSGVIGDAAHIPIGDSCADWVSLNAGLHHLANLTSVLAEIDRVLKPGGYFCLGHEPNAAFFRSRWLYRLERFIWNLFWYGSFSRNMKRIKRKLGLRINEYEQHEHLDIINTRLQTEGLLDTPMSIAELRDLVDVSSHEQEEEEDNSSGFHVLELLDRHFARYHMEVIYYSDYGGEMLHHHPGIRRIYDGVMRKLAPDKGRLFSWILRKPAS